MGRYVDLAKEIEADLFCGEPTCELSELSEKRVGSKLCELSEKRVGSEPVHPETSETAAWGDLGSIMAWFRSATPPAEPFLLKQGITISNPQRWWADIIADIGDGPEGPRARYGALQDDLWRAWQMFGPQAMPGGNA